jgi:hypothetical protein
MTKMDIDDRSFLLGASRRDVRADVDVPTRRGVLARWRRGAWFVIVIADIGLLLWGASAALIPNQLPGPGGVAILPAGYEGYSGGSWHHLATMAAPTAGYVTLVFRMYGIYIVAFSMLAIAIAATAFRHNERWAWWTLLLGNSLGWISAMTYDRIVGAIGPFEMTEYLGLALIYASLALTFGSWRVRPLRVGDPSSERADTPGAR